MKQLQTLKIGQKYTVVRFGEMGFVFGVQLLLTGIEVKPFAQYPESTILVFRKKGARKPTGMRFLPNDDYLVFPGWVKVNTSMFVSEGRSASGLVTRQSLLSCDREYLNIAKVSSPVPPLLEKITPFPNADTARILGGGSKGAT